MDRKVYEKLKSADWLNILPRLLYFTSRKVKYYSWKTGGKDNLSMGKSAEDIAHEAIEKVWSGERQWNPDKYPDLLIYLKSVVKSLVSHLALSLANQFEIRTDESGSVGHTNNFEDQVIEVENLKNFQDALLTEVNGDKELEDVVLAIMEGYEKPGEISQYLGIDIHRLYKVKEKLKRKTLKIISVLQ